MKKTFKCCVVMVVLGVVGNFSVEAGITDKIRNAMKPVFDDGGGGGDGDMHNKGKNDEKEKDDNKGDKGEDEDNDEADIKGKKEKNADRFKGDIVSSTTDDEGNITTTIETEDGNYITQVTDEDGNLVSTVVTTYSHPETAHSVEEKTQVTIDEATGKVTVEYFAGDT